MKRVPPQTSISAPAVVVNGVFDMEASPVQVAPARLADTGAELTLQYTIAPSADLLFASGEWALFVALPLSKVVGVTSPGRSCGLSGLHCHAR